MGRSAFLRSPSPTLPPPGEGVILKRICPPPAYSINAASKLLTRQLVKSSKDKRRWQNSRRRVKLCGTCVILSLLCLSPSPSPSPHFPSSPRPNTVWSTVKRDKEKRRKPRVHDSRPSLLVPFFQPSFFTRYAPLCLFLLSIFSILPISPIILPHQSLFSSLLFLPSFLPSASGEGEAPPLLLPPLELHLVVLV